MNPRIIGYALLASAFVLGLGANVARAAEAPKDNKGYTASKTTVVELGRNSKEWPDGSSGCGC